MPMSIDDSCELRFAAAAQSNSCLRLLYLLARATRVCCWLRSCRAGVLDDHHLEAAGDLRVQLDADVVGAQGLDLRNLHGPLVQRPSGLRPEEGHTVSSKLRAVSAL